MNQGPTSEHNSEQAKQQRRKFLIGASGSLGIGAGLLALWGFLNTFRPSRKTKAEGAAVKVSVKGMQPAELRRTVWRKKLIWVLARGQEQLQNANNEEVTSQLSDPESDSSLQPDYCKNKLRSRKDEYFVAIGLCTHLGCSPKWDPSQDGGVFYCACHGSRFDVAGRVFSGSPAPSNLVIPPHYFDEDDNVVIGADDAPAA